MMAPRKKLRLVVIAEPAEGTRSVLVLQTDSPGFRVDADVPDYCCGKCGNILFHGVDINRFVNVVVQCHPCGAFNETIVADDNRVN